VQVKRLGVCKKCSLALSNNSRATNCSGLGECNNTNNDINDVPHYKREKELDKREWARAVITPSDNNG
jgi:hypothetical protein